MNIVLIGFMGSGKSSVGRVLSDKLSFEFIEMDVLVLQKSGRGNINEIFEKDGEPAFRKLEQEVAEGLQNKNNAVISTGGGVVENSVIMDYLGKNGRIIFLSVPFAEIKKRLKDLNDRPLFKNKYKAEELYISRESLYDKYADIKVPTDGKSIDAVANEIITAIKN